MRTATPADWASKQSYGEIHLTDTSVSDMLYISMIL